MTTLAKNAKKKKKKKTLSIERINLAKLPFPEEVLIKLKTRHQMAKMTFWPKK